jgi:tetratricopeptide (TPR) repeat protein
MYRCINNYQKAL